MLTIAYIANQFPSPVEPYVVDEIEELRGRGVEVVPCSARRVHRTVLSGERERLAAETLYLQPLGAGLLVRALWLCLCRLDLLGDLLVRILLRGRESPSRKARALLHTWLGACLALRLAGRGVEHIHAHHGYFSAWVAMVAARLLGVSFSMTLHGSDLLLHRAYLDTKLQNCRFCMTVSSFNRKHILEHYPQIDADKVIVQRLGVDTSEPLFPAARAQCDGGRAVLLSVGRLHTTKDHAFLIRACRRLKDNGFKFLCLLAGEGPERARLEHLIAELNLEAEVKLLGHIAHKTLNSYYAMADLVILTSRSEGIPLTLMEAMAKGRPVLAPAITGIPELVVDGRTGYLYQPGSLQDVVARVRMICELQQSLEPLCLAARQHVLEHFSREKNLGKFADAFLAQINENKERVVYEDLVLQQI